MNRRTFLQAVAAAFRPAASQPPNFIFLLADDLGWGDLGCYGNRRLQTPTLDHMAQQGILFKQFYAVFVVCSPSASFLTGRFTLRHGIHSHLREKAFNLMRGLPRCLNPDQPMLPRLLQSAG